MFFIYSKVILIVLRSIVIQTLVQNSTCKTSRAPSSCVAMALKATGRMQQMQSHAKKSATDNATLGTHHVPLVIFGRCSNVAENVFIHNCYL